LRAPGRSLPRPLAPLQYRDFRLLFLSALTSGVGDQLQTVSNLWQVYALTGSALHLGLTGMARFGAIMLFSLIGGLIADRFDRRRIVVFAQVGVGVAAIALAALSATGLVEVWHIYLATFTTSSLTSLNAPARRALIVNAVPRTQLMTAMALNMTVNQLDRMIAPAIGGILIAYVGLPITYAGNGIAHVLTAAAVAGVAMGPVRAPSQESPLQSLIDGLAFVRRRSIILVLLTTDLAAMLFGSYQVILPILADGFGVGAVGYGLLQSAPAVGSVIGAVVIMALADMRYKGYLIVGSILGYCVCLAALAVAPSFSLALLAGAGLGLTNSMQAAPRNAVIQLIIPDEVRGRVTSFQHMLTGGGPALGQAMMGAAMGMLGPVALVLGGIACAAVNITLLVTRRDLRAANLGDAPDETTMFGRAEAPRSRAIV
jgi:MFS family permease